MVSHQQAALRNDFVTLTCPSCGGRLQITKDMDKFACGHCGNEHLVRREGGAVFLAPLAADIRQIRGGVDKTAAELAVIRLAKEVDILQLKFNNLSKRTDHEWVLPSDLERWAPGLTFLLPIVIIVIMKLVVPEYPNVLGWVVVWVLSLLSVATFIGGLVLHEQLRSKRLHVTNEIKKREMTTVDTLRLEKQVLLTKNRLIVDS
jgi:predicted RNA-binding Zn-ribbon protein involved in translation (DUF1610 family)